MPLLARLLLLFAVALPGLPLARATELLRFSKTLAAPEATATGLTQLDADQLAILDALVRHDIANWDYVPKTPRPPRFSQRLSADERHNSGLDLLKEPQLVQLDAAVEKLMPVAPRGSYAAQASAPSAPGPILSAKINRDPQIHGQFTFTVGAGSHGYSVIGGSMLLTYDDPANRFSVAVGYSEYHTKGGYYGPRSCLGRYDPFDPFYPGYGW